MASAISSDLCCPACLDLFTEPLLLSCSHSLCKDCALGLVCLDQMRIDGPKGLPCPTCRALTPIPNGVDSLRVNAPLKKAVEEYKHQVAGVIKCRNCDERGAETECLTCKAAFCAKCQAETHPGAAQKGHQFAELGTMAKQQKNAESMLCKEHREEKKLFCVTCGCLICTACGHHGQHKDHTFYPVVEAVKLQPPMKNAVGSLQEAAAKVKRLYGLLSEAQDNLADDSQPSASSSSAALGPKGGEDSSKKLDDIKQQKTALSSLRRRIVRGLALSVTAKEPADKLLFVAYVKALQEDVTQSRVNVPPPPPAGTGNEKVLMAPNVTFTAGILQKFLVQGAEPMPAFEFVPNLNTPDAALPKRNRFFSTAAWAKRGKHEWSVKVSGDHLMVGVATRTAANLGHLMRRPGFFMCTADRMMWSGPPVSPTGGCYSCAIAAGSIVTVHLDMDTHTLRYSVNGRDIGIACRDLPPGPLHPAVCVLGNGQPKGAVEFV